MSEPWHWADARLSPPPETPERADVSGGLSEAERTALAVAVHDTDAAGCACESVYAAVDRILADRLAAVQAERDVWQKTAERKAAQAHVAEADAAAARAERDALRASIWALGESIHGDEGVEHNDGCEGEPDCLACIIASLRAVLGGDQ